MSGATTTGSASQSGAPVDLLTEVWGTYAKLKGMQELENQALFTRDSKRLDAKARAAYEKLGFTLKDVPGELHMIADDVTLDEAARADIFKRLDNAEMGDVRIVADNITFAGGKPEATAPVAEPTPAPTVPAPVAAVAAEAKSWVTPALVGLATAGLLGSGIGIPVSYYLGRQREPAPTVAPPTKDTDTNTRGVLELVPEEGQRLKN